MEWRDDQRITASKSVLSRVLDGEAVLLDLEGGIYFGLNEVGTEVWELLGEGSTVAEIRAKLLASFEVDEETVRADLERLLDELKARGLVDVASS